ncbi:hypothetical protein VaNZ11_016148 [Volvox africanus]|uniref:Inosine/uridine-preferring nucleoside hydrolase domain-containing protein n=1 Tax=Volvox africanus TaxID=51714 RepID=A0ABQ5SPI7_9CHLO|nr:hypothetical protein VaNZ11_016148 [Volvox africanus]
MEHPIPVWLDCDPGHDDATAILLAGHTPGLHLLGISTIGGNQTLAKVTQNALDVLDALGLSHIGVVAGQPRPLMRSPLLCPEIHGETGLDGPGGGRLLPRSARKPLPGKAVNVMFAAIAAAYEELQLYENHSGGDGDGDGGDGGVGSGGDGGVAAGGSRDSCRSGDDGRPKVPVAKQQGPADAVYTAEEPAPQGAAGAIRKTAVGEVRAIGARRVRLVCTGALTNAALLFTVYPEVVDWLEVAIMGGCMGVGNTGPVMEFNIQTDPEAAKIVFESGVPLTMVPLEVTHTVLATPKVLEAMGGRCGSAASTAAAATAAGLPMLSPTISPFRHTIQQLLLFFAESYREVFHFEYPPLHDPVAVAWIIRPGLFECRRMRVDVETCSSLSYGQTVCDIWCQSRRPANVNVALKVDVEGFWELLLAAVARADAVSPLQCDGSTVGGDGSGGLLAASATDVVAVAASRQP